jgi:hypothetical protein
MRCAHPKNFVPQWPSDNNSVNHVRRKGQCGTNSQRGGSRQPGYNRSVSSERRLLAAIFAALVLLFAAPWVVRRAHDAFRPRLVEVRIVTATDADRVFREGPRRVGPGEEAAIAVALRLSYPRRGDRWLAPVERLSLDGMPVDHEPAETWPERDRRVRVFWFTVESGNVGGTVTPERAAHLLRYRSFLANEMGHDLRAASLPEAHNDDHLGPQPDQIPVDAGTLRLYARVEVFDPERDVRALQSASTADAGNAVDPSYPAIHRSVRLADGLRSEAGELFNLPGWEVEPDEPGAWDEAARAAFGLRFAEAVERRLATSSRSFAAVAATGGAELPAGRGAAELDVELRDGRASSGGRELRWGEELRAGDILVDGGHYSVLVADDGDGRLSASDTVAHCWRRPPALTTLAAVLPAPPARARLLRHGS